MKIGIVGGSASGLYAALLLALKHPDWDITVFDRMDKAGRKLLATGNGHCNLLHVPFKPKAFNHPEFIKDLLDRHPLESMMATLEELRVPVTKKGELIYPLSYSASAHVRHLATFAESLGVRFHFGEPVTDVQDAKLIVGGKPYVFDVVIFAFGGKSQENLGSDGSMFGILSSKGYEVTPLRPSLCPMRCTDVGKSLFGVRHGAVVKLLRGDKIIYKETGEVQFKKDGISGIAVMNASSHYEKGDYIVLDLFPDKEVSDLLDLLLQHEGFPMVDRLARIMETSLAEYVVKKFGITQNPHILSSVCKMVAQYLKKMPLMIDGLYDFDSSQVTRGGIALSEVDEHLRSKKNPAHYFIGECLDIDGICGGYNLGFALLSAMEVADAL